MAAVLHVLDDPLKTCAEIRRLLAPGGVFLLVDWVWLLNKGGFKVLDQAQLRSEHFCELMCQAK
jgi:SAM-dependent methyltransferase